MCQFDTSPVTYMKLFVYYYPPFVDSYGVEDIIKSYAYDKSLTNGKLDLLKQKQVGGFS